MRFLGPGNLWREIDAESANTDPSSIPGDLFLFFKNVEGFEYVARRFSDHSMDYDYKTIVPRGLLGYPLRENWNYIVTDNKIGIINLRKVFESDHVWLVRWRLGSKIVRSSNYDVDSFRGDCVTLFEFLSHSRHLLCILGITNLNAWDKWQGYVESVCGHYSHPLEKFWHLTGKVSEAIAFNNRPDYRANGWNYILKQLGYDGFIDDVGLDIIAYPGEKEAYFLSKDGFDGQMRF